MAVLFARDTAIILLPLLGYGLTSSMFLYQSYFTHDSKLSAVLFYHCLSVYEITPHSLYVHI